MTTKSSTIYDDTQAVQKSLRIKSSLWKLKLQGLDRQTIGE